MNNRIIELIKAENLTAIKFAERLDVQPSNISHIISGRNKPGYDFIVKVLERFPNINPDWLLLGKGSMYKANQRSKAPSIIENFDITNVMSDLDSMMDMTPNHTIDTTHSERHNQSTSMNTSGKSVVKIILFYSDNSFDVFNGRK